MEAGWLIETCPLRYTLVRAGLQVEIIIVTEPALITPR